MARKDRWLWVARDAAEKGEVTVWRTKPKSWSGHDWDCPDDYESLVEVFEYREFVRKFQLKLSKGELIKVVFSAVRLEA